MTSAKMCRVTVTMIMTVFVMNGGCGDETSAELNGDCSSPNVVCPLGSVCGYQAGAYSCVPEEGSNMVPVGGRDAGVNATEPAEEMNDAPWGPGIGSDEESDEPRGSEHQPEAGQMGGDVDGCRAVRVSLKPNRSAVPRMMLVVERPYSMVGIEDR